MSERGKEYLQSTSKRNLDLLAGVAIATALSPIAAALAPVVMLNTRTSRALFTQERVGKRGAHFDVVKFRTIPLRRQNEQIVPIGSYDQRASRVGMAMRDIGIDEIPQLHNVLKGDMSIVGPRPLLKIDIDRLRDIDSGLFDEWHEVYSQSKPGLLGPSQFRRHEYRVTEDALWQEGMRLDIDYAEKASLNADLKIIASSPFKMALARLRLVDNVEAASEISRKIEDLISEDDLLRHDIRASAV